MYMHIVRLSKEFIECWLKTAILGFMHHFSYLQLGHAIKMCNGESCIQFQAFALYIGVGRIFSRGAPVDFSKIFPGGGQK